MIRLYRGKRCGARHLVALHLFVRRGTGVSFAAVVALSVVFIGGSIAYGDLLDVLVEFSPDSIPVVGDPAESAWTHCGVVGTSSLSTGPGSASRGGGAVAVGPCRC